MNELLLLTFADSLYESVPVNFKKSRVKHDSFLQNPAQMLKERKKKVFREFTFIHFSYATQVTLRKICELY